MAAVFHIDPNAGQQPSRRPVLAWLIDGEEAYGVRRTTLEFSRALEELGWNTAFLALRDGAFTRECLTAGRWVVIADLPHPPFITGGVIESLRAFGSLRRYEAVAVRRLLPLLKEIAPQSIHVRWPSYVGLAGRLGRCLGIPVLWQMPNTVADRYPLGLNRWVYQWRCRRSHIQPVANSHYTAATLGSALVRPRVVHLAADPQRFDPDKVAAVSRSALGIPRDDLVFGIFARLHSSKGQLRFFQALSQVARRIPCPPLHLVLLGDEREPGYADALHQAAAASHHCRLHMLGHVPDPECYYGLLDVAVNSRIDPEPFGLSVIEAMMMGKPVLVHALGGPAETVIDGGTGWHMPSPRIEDMQAGIARAIEQRAQWGQLGMQARQHALDHFTVTPAARQLNQILTGLLRR